jgi:archaellum biogenesis ATPase FlaH
MSEHQFLSIALDAATRGSAVIPVGEDGQPLVSIDLATTFDGSLRRWAARYPSAHVGKVVDGRVAGILSTSGIETDEILAARLEAPRVSVSPGTKITLLSDVEPQSVEWLWPGRIPLGAISLLEGDPGLGKSSVALDLAARLSRGEAMPDGSLGPASAGTVILSSEDDLSRVIRPRLDAANAVVKRIATVHGTIEGVDRELLIRAEDLKRIETGIHMVGARLLILDPLVAYLPGDVNANSDQDVRRAMAALRDLAERTGIAVVAIRHLRKASADRAIYRGAGSIAIVAAARAALLVAREPSDPTGERRVLAVAKMNLAEVPVSCAFRLVSGSGKSPARVVWEGSSTQTAEALLAPIGDVGRPAALEEAAELLREILGNGPMSATDVYRSAKEAGVSPMTLRRAGKRVGITSVKRGGPRQSQSWYWSLPGDSDERADTSLDNDHLQMPDNAKPLHRREKPEGDHPEHDHLQTKVFNASGAPRPPAPGAVEL